MPHSLICGKSKSGKTFLAQALAWQYQAKGIPVLVLDPFNDPAWPADWKTTNRARFMEVALANRGAALFLDEGSNSVGLSAEMEWITTQSRHWGYRAHLITQRPRQIALTIRDQCEFFYFFRLGPLDSKKLAEDYDSPLVRNAHKLPRHYFIQGGDYIPFRLRKLAA